MQTFYFLNFFKQQLCIFSQKLSNKNKQRLYKIQKCPTSLFYHALLIKQNECSSINEFIHSFFGRIRGYQKSFRNYLTFSSPCSWSLQVCKFSSFNLHWWHFKQFPEHIKKNVIINASLLPMFIIAKLWIKFMTLKSDL